MDLLQQARAEIDAVDTEMAALFERRMQAVADVVRYKAETGKPVFDAAREADVITRNTARLQNEELRPYYKAFLQEAEIVVDARCCAGVTPESHRNALEAMKMCQIHISDVK